MMTLHVLSAGSGYEYLTRQVASGDQARAGQGLSAYYAESGYPPGRWLGAGLTGLDAGRSLAGKVTTEQMARLFGTGADPVTAAPLGQRYLLPVPVAQRITERLAALPTGLDPAARQAVAATIEQQEKARRVRRPVAGFDCVFTPAKSVSVLWALGDESVRQAVLDAHHAAIEATLAYLQAEVARTRVGKGGIAQLDTRGLIAAGFDHWDSRPVVDSGGAHTDPNLHTHVVIANRVQGPDGRWRTVDSQAMFHAVVACSERYNTLIADELTRRLGVTFEDRDTGRGRRPVREVAGIGAALIGEFSSRRAQIDEQLRRLIATFRTEHGREPSAAEQIRLAQTATLIGRAAKDSAHPSLAELLAGWRTRAAALDPRSPETIVAEATRRHSRLLSAEEVPEPEVARLAATVIDALAARRATWTRWHVDAEATRASAQLPMASPDERDRLIRTVAERASSPGLVIDLTPPVVVAEPAALRRADGESVFSRHNTARFTCAAILDAEGRLLDAAHRRGPAVPPALVAESIAQAGAADGHTLAPDQAAAVSQIATSGRVLDVLIGPAGTGKTTTLRTLSAAWQAAFGPGSVLLLAPSAPAARVLSDAVQERGDNLAKWLYETDGDGGARRRARTDVVDARLSPLSGPAAAAARAERRALAVEELRWSVSPGQLVVVDEASLAGTLALDALRAQVEKVGAKLLLAGDPAQLAAVEAGGALRLLAAEVGAAELCTVWRFTQPWEAEASLALRAGDPAVIDAYGSRGRLRAGSDQAMNDAAYTGWLADEQAGLVSLLIAADNTTVAVLNARARADRLAAGSVEPAGTRLHDGTAAGVGDRIVTRHNDRMLLTAGGHDFVKNGDLWTVVARQPDGSLAVRNTRHGGHALLPARYVAGHVELGYATTAHRCQGMTVDTAHLLATDTLTRELLYVGLTRGTGANTGYVVTEHAIDPGLDHPPDDPVTARDILEQVLRRVGSELSATETLRSAQTAETSAATTLRRLDYAASLAEPDEELDRYLTELRDCLHPPRYDPVEPRSETVGSACYPVPEEPTLPLAGPVPSR